MEATAEGHERDRERGEPRVDGPGRDDEVAALRAQVGRLEEQVQELLRRDRRPAAAPRPATVPTSIPEPTPVLDPTSTPGPQPSAGPRTAAARLDRRSLLRVAGAGAAVTAAATSATVAAGLATAGPAVANNGDAIVAGTTTTSTNSTYLQDLSGSTKTTHIFCATDEVSFPPTATAAAVGGEAHNNTVAVGVLGSTTNPNSYGVLGKLLGLSTGAGAAVWGNGGFAGTGVLATTNAGATATGLEASGGIGATIAGATANLRLVPGGAAAPSRGDATAGYLVVDQNDDLWLAVGGGTWRKLGGPATAGSLHVLDATTRIYDSRPGTQPAGGIKTMFQSGTERVLDSKVGNAVPAGARAVMITATATNTNPGGYFAFFKNGITWPKNSSLSWGQAGSTVATTTVVAVDTAATFKAHMEGVGGSDLVVDVIGYYR